MVYFHLQLALYLVSASQIVLFFFFFFNDTATTEIYTLSLHDALPISFQGTVIFDRCPQVAFLLHSSAHLARGSLAWRSEEHTSELQSQSNLVCRLLLEKKKQPGTRH